MFLIALDLNLRQLRRTLGLLLKHHPYLQVLLEHRLVILVSLSINISVPKLLLMYNQTTGTSVSPFGRYVSPFGFAGLTHFGRDISLGGHLDAWR